jgi:hypothetical protein
MRLVLFHQIPYNTETSMQVLLKVSEDGVDSTVTRLRAERSGAKILTNQENSPKHMNWFSGPPDTQFST